MMVRFGNNRLVFYIAVFALSGVVLGLAAKFASIFFPKYHHDFIIFALIAPALTIFTFLLTLQWAQPRTEAIILTILSIVWLTMAAWTGDIIGYVQCDSLGGQSTPARSGNTNAQTFCYEMKVVQAFSWALFIGCILALYILFQLVNLAQRLGQPIQMLPWFGEYPGHPGYYNTHGGGVVPTYYPTNPPVTHIYPVTYQPGLPVVVPS